MKLKPVKDQSLREKLRSSLISYIQSLSSSGGDKLPREERLAKELGVSRNTVRGVLTELEQEGFIIRKHGKGTFVNPEALKLKVPLIPAIEFGHMIDACGYKANLKLIKVETKQVDQKITEAFKINLHDPVVCAEKMFYADESPAIYCVDRFPRHLIEGEILDHELDQVIYYYLRKKAGITVVREKSEFFSITSEEHKDLKTNFKVDRVKSFLACESVEFDEENNPVLFNSIYFNTDYIRFTQIRPKQIAYAG